mgnify:CR=1 FL=1
MAAEGRQLVRQAGRQVERDGRGWGSGLRAGQGRAGKPAT